MTQIGITSKESVPYPVLESNSKKRMFRQRMAQIGITQKETSTASQPASQPR